MSSPKFGRQIFDPADAVAILQKRFDQENVRLMFSDQFARIVETMGATANAVALVASDNCGHPLFADTRIPNHHDPAERKDRASCGAFFHGCMTFYKSATANAILNLRFLRKYLPAIA